MIFIGLDAGSVSVKLVALDAKGNKLFSCYERHKGHPLAVALKLLGKAIEPKNYDRGENPYSPGVGSLDSSSLSVTGSAGRLIASIFQLIPINEIVAQAYATHNLSPDIKTVIEMGGKIPN